MGSGGSGASRAGGSARGRAIGQLPRPVQRLMLAAGITVALGVLLTPLIATGQLGGIGRQLSEAQYPTGPIDERLVIVELPSSALGWDRTQHADLIRAVAEAGASVIAYDVVFDQPRTPEEDADLVDAVADAGNVVLGASGELGADRLADPLLLVNVAQPLEPLWSAAAGVGHVNVGVTVLDGVVREVPLVLEGEDRRFVPSLSLAAVSLLEGVDPGVVTLNGQGGINIGERYVPSRPQRVLEPNWAIPFADNPARRDASVVVAADEVLAGTADLDDRLVMVGLADRLAGQQDFPATPVAKGGMPGVYVHANAANTMLTNLYRTGPSTAATIVASVGLVALLAFPGMFLPLRYAPFGVVGFIAAWQAYVNVRFQQGVTVDNLWPNLAVLLGAGAVVAARYVTEVRDKRRVARLFKQYVPDVVVEELVASDRLEAVREGERREVTVLFCDLRGFTATSATLEPAGVRQMLEVYYDHCTKVIHDHAGTVMQFVGDEVFAVFGAPVDQPDHAQRALDAARGMVAAGEQINAELADRGVSVAYGIGLNTGEVVAAHVGSQVHKQYAVVGQTVNVGARLCSTAGKGEIVASIDTRRQLTKPYESVPLGEVTLKGVKHDPEPHRILT